jgi:hypothetical protein
MVLKTRSWSLLTVPKRSSPRVVIANQASSRLQPGVWSTCRGRYKIRRRRQKVGMLCENRRERLQIPAQVLCLLPDQKLMADRQYDTEYFVPGFQTWLWHLQESCLWDAPRSTPEKQRVLTECTTVARVVTPIRWKIWKLEICPSPP